MKIPFNFVLYHRITAITVIINDNECTDGKISSSNWFMSHEGGGAIFSDSGLAGGPVVEIMG